MPSLSARLSAIKDLALTPTRKPFWPTYVTLMLGSVVGGSLMGISVGYVSAANRAFHSDNPIIGWGLGIILTAAALRLGGHAGRYAQAAVERTHLNFYKSAPAAIRFGERTCAAVAGSFGACMVTAGAYTYRHLLEAVL